MARTKGRWSRIKARLLHVELLENRCLLTGSTSLLGHLSSFHLDLVLPAVSVEQAPLIASPDNQVAFDVPFEPGLDGSQENGAAPSGSQDSQSATSDDPSLPPGGVGNAATDTATGGSAKSSSATDSSTDPTNLSLGGSTQNPIASIQDSTIGAVEVAPVMPLPGTLAPGKVVTPTAIEDLPITPITIGLSNLNDQQGNDAGSGTSGQDSGTSGTGDQGLGTSGDNSGAANGSDPSSSGPTDGNYDSPTAPANPGNHQPPVDNSGGSSANTGRDTPPINPADNGASAPKVQDDSAQRISLALAQVENVKNIQKTLADQAAHLSNGDSARLAEPSESPENANEKKPEGVKESFTVGEKPPTVVEIEAPQARGDDQQPESVELAAEPLEAQALARALPSAGSGLLASVASFDLPALEQGVQGFFTRLDQLGQQIVTAQGQAGVTPWLVALASAGVALEIARRKLKPAQGELELDANGQDPSWTWFVHPADPLPPDPG